MNNLNDLNFPPDPPEAWQAKVGRLIKDVFLPYAVPYVIPVFLGWKLTRRLQYESDPEGSGRISSLHREIQDLKQQVRNYQNHANITEKREQQRLKDIRSDLDTIAELLEERQDIYCSPIKLKEGRFAVEERLQNFVVERPFQKDLGLFKGVKEILKYDSHCGNTRKENGCLMWVYMELWQIKAQLNMKERVLSDIRDYGAKHR